MIICLSFLTVGIFLALSNNLQHTAQAMSRNLVIVFFLEKGVPAQTVKAVEEDIMRSGLFTKSEFTSTDQALERFKDKFPELQDILKNLEINPFPASIEATLNEKHLDSSQTRIFLEIMQLKKGIEDIRFNKDWVERMKSLSRLAQAVGFFLGGILLFASFFIVSNVIKLNVMARKDEIEILRLVGSTNSFIRIPFLLEGVFLGILGGVFSLLLLFVVIKLFPVYIGSSLGVLSEFVRFRFLSLSQSLILVFSGSIVGLLGSSSSLSKFLKI
jgi:cell division transport system permease protein